MLIIFTSSSIPSKDLPKNLYGLDIVFHFLEYMVLGLLASSYFGIEKAKTVFILCSIFALSDEVHQLFIDGRTFSIKDLVADVFGIFTGFKIILRWLK
jgi:VanZ family protein